MNKAILEETLKRLRLHQAMTHDTIECAVIQGQIDLLEVILEASQ